MIEMNCEFEIFEDNIVLLKNILGDIYPLPKDDKKLTSNFSRQLLSVCSCLTEKPFIQIQGKSLLCSNLAKDLL